MTTHNNNIDDARVIAAINLALGYMGNGEKRCPICSATDFITGTDVIAHVRECTSNSHPMSEVVGPDGGYARLLDTDPKFESFVRGYIDKAEGRA